MSSEQNLKISGKIIYRKERINMLFGKKRVTLQILLNKDSEFEKLLSVAEKDQVVMDSNLFFKTNRSQAIPPCINYHAKNKKDGLYFAEVDDLIEITFKGVILSLEDYALKVHHFNPPISILKARVI